MNACDLLHPFADGELVAAERPAFHRHLGGCLACQDELQGVMMLDALAATFAASLRGNKRWQGPVVLWEGEPEQAS